MVPGDHVAVSYAVLGDPHTDIRGQRRYEWALQMAVPVESREYAFFTRQRHGRSVGGVADDLHQAGGELPCRVAAVMQPEHDQRIAEPRDAKPDPARGAGGLPLLRQGKARRVNDIVEKPRRDLGRRNEVPLVDIRLWREGIAHKLGEVQEPRSQAP